MEEDIKVLEDCYVMTTNHVLDEENIKLKKAIKNTIEYLNYYKEQRKHDENFKRELLEEIRCKDLEIERNKIKELSNIKIGIDLSYDDYIPKQKIQNKIDELKSKIVDNDELKFTFNNYIQIRMSQLQELLEDKGE